MSPTTNHFTSMKLAIIAALMLGVAADLPTVFSFTWKDCGDASTKAKITNLTPTTITLGETTTISVKGDLSEGVDGATYDFTMRLVNGALLHCSGDAAASHACYLGTTGEEIDYLAYKKDWPITPGTFKSSNVQIHFTPFFPKIKTKSILTATGKNGDKLLCVEIDGDVSTSHAESRDRAAQQVHAASANGTMLSIASKNDAKPGPKPSETIAQSDVEGQESIKTQQVTIV
jgi:hypothetical protein